MCASAKKARDAVLENLVDEVLVSKGLFLLGVLADDAHYLAQAVRIVDCHLNSCQRFRLIQQEMNVITHLSLLLTLECHDLLLLSFELLVVSRTRRLNKKHVIDVFRLEVTRKW